jgi:ArsR family transcriptional regulator, arsenate/arsenite/antimonite-responsive transcriptional repressor
MIALGGTFERVKHAIKHEHDRAGRNVQAREACSDVMEPPTQASGSPMQAAEAVRALGALAHEHRLAIYRMLVERGPTGLAAGVIAERLGCLPSSLTFHLQHLQRAGLIVPRRTGRQMIYAADFTHMTALVGFLTENCCGGRERVCLPDPP